MYQRVHQDASSLSNAEAESDALSLTALANDEADRLAVDVAASPCADEQAVGNGVAARVLLTVPAPQGAPYIHVRGGT